jgi:Ca-activated chloride channel family protein
MTFAQPLVLLALLLIPLILWGARRKRGPTQAVVYSDLRLLAAAGRSGRARWAWLPRFLWWLAVISFILALARPQERNVRQEILAPGIDIVLALDMSTSMLTTDFPPNRFAAAKEVLKKFIASRSTDRIALVVFAGRAYTQVPLTFDYHAVQHMIDALAVGQLEDGTAIGMGMVESINRLKVSTAKSKVMILLTDGVNNRGRIDPKTALEIAKLKGIKVYTIGMGLTQNPRNRGLFEQAFGASPEATMNVGLLKQIAKDTGGDYFEAANLEDLTSIYEQIGALEKIDVKMNEFVSIKEWFPKLLALGLALFLLGWLLDLTWLRKVP